MDTMEPKTATAIAERTPEQQAVEAEARHLCRRYEGELAPQVMEAMLQRTIDRIAYRRWQQACEPLQRLKTDVATSALNFMLPQYILHEDGRLERREVPLPKDTLALLDQIQQMILAEARRYGLRGEG